MIDLGACLKYALIISLLGIWIGGCEDKVVNLGSDVPGTEDTGDVLDGSNKGTDSELMDEDGQQYDVTDSGDIADTDSAFDSGDDSDEDDEEEDDEDDEEEEDESNELD